MRQSSYAALAARRFRHSLKNLHVARATAKIARQRFTDVVQRRLGLFFQQMAGAQNHSRSADAALRAAAFQKGCLQCAQLRTFGEALNRRKICARGLQRRYETAIDQLAVHQDGARTTFALAATFLRAGQPELLSQDIQQPLHGKNANGFRLAVYGKGKLAFGAILAATLAATFGGVAHRSPLAETASKISSGMSGTESKRVPRASPRASWMALTIAGAGPSMGSSPIPFAPYAP